MRVVSQSKLVELQNKPSNIRNICILAHVDHGKTTLADSLVASNGIISQKMAGKLRYMDSRKDEQERGITMKSSCITLYFSPIPETEVLVNLIDSPGHVDFSSEVSTAVRLCDGAIVVVDVVEGVCPQTRVALKQAWLENIKPILILNKIDRLITEMKLSPLDAYIHLTQVLEQMNAVMGELFLTEVMEKTDTVPENSITTSKNKDQENVYDWSTGVEDADDSNLYFSPETGNVIFASAVDGWGFGVQEFAKMYSEKLGFKEELLNKVLWGDFYLNSKTKRVMKGAQEKAKKPLFVQLVLENIWNLYDILILRKDREKVGPIVEKLGIKLTTRDLRLTDMRLLLQAITNQWLPLANAVLNAVYKKLPSPLEITSEKVEKLMCSQNTRFDFLPPQTQALKEHFLACKSTSDVPVIVYISKMFPIEKKSLPENKPKPLTMEEIAQRRELARSRHAQKQLDIENATTPLADQPEVENVSPELVKDDDEDAFVAFARVFSGVLRKGIELYVLGPKHNPADALKSSDIDPNLTLKDLRGNQHVTKVTIESLYLLMGRELELLEEVPAGNVLGIGGLDEHVLKTATLSTSLFCPSFTEMQLMAVPIVRVAVEPKNPADIPKLRKGLRLLNQADACVQVLIQETGEHVLITAGEVHLERCIDDLQQRYAKIELNVSEPIVPFRETIVEPPKVDMVNETIEVSKKEETDTLITIWTPNKQMCLSLRALPLPQNVATLLENNNDLLKTVDKVFGRKKIVEKLCELKINELLAERTLKRITSLKDELEKEFMQDSEKWKGIVDNMMCVGPRKCGPNVFWNKVKDYPRSSMWEIFNELSDPRIDFDASLLNGFQLATLSGPMCEEPMMGVCFVLESWSYDPTVVDTGVYGPLSGQVVSVVKDGCRKAFQAQPQRLMAAMYSCNILANTEVLGKMYAVLGRRNGRILSGDMTQGSANFVVTAVLPVVESFQFATEIRKQTSGLASPQLVFSHWEIIEIDPYWTPNTEEEYLHFGEKADSANRARQYMDSVRRRKGLHVETKLVEFAEKQRTIKKNK
ncbi:elongation factor-like GTPase 1 [Chrysoperla carnea]|uniref:elongation factor-like GTPase 1 n=1 Tax=Chrysoperla carnea TaxID=189513 RepID=UPI001D068997|nr:elongation factor-like GTPase 1 [Chrysoperla carnea]